MGRRFGTFTLNDVFFHIIHLLIPYSLAHPLFLLTLLAILFAIFVFFDKWLCGWAELNLSFFYCKCFGSDERRSEGAEGSQRPFAGVHRRHTAQHCRALPAASWDQEPGCWTVSWKNNIPHFLDNCPRRQKKETNWKKITWWQTAIELWTAPNIFLAKAPGKQCWFVDWGEIWCFVVWVIRPPKPTVCCWEFEKAPNFFLFFFYSLCPWKSVAAAFFTHAVCG